mmetsp:Transcript_18094/g.31000  ORF Transcript_18094/g.31000 Transcript_18094/m.31000 type:complete len:408 (+) Transcript_18094:23-1246(+)
MVWAGQLALTAAKDHVLADTDLRVNSEPASIRRLPASMSAGWRPLLSRLRRRITGGNCRALSSAADEAGPALHQVTAYTLKGYAPGYKDENQDAHTSVQPFVQGDQSFHAVFDGHGQQGQCVSGFAQQKLPGILSALLQAGHLPAEALRKAFIQVDAAMANQGFDAVNSGCTAAVALVHGNTSVDTAWVGDSRIVLGSRVKDGSWLATTLTSDHKPELPGERKRILACGGRVQCTRDRTGQSVGPMRVWLFHIDAPGLAMSRALGDLVARPIGVIAMPDVRTIQLKQDDVFLLLASDGLWDFVNEQEAVENVGRALDQSSAPDAIVQTLPRLPRRGRDVRQAQPGQDPTGRPLQLVGRKGADSVQGALELVATELVVTAKKRWDAEYAGRYVDDITLLIVRLQDRPQ